MQNRYEEMKGLRPHKERQNTERCIRDPWKRNCSDSHKGYILGKQI